MNTLSLFYSIDHIEKVKAKEPHSINTSALIIALVSGVFSGLVTGTLQVLLGVSILESSVFAGLSGFMIACFVWIERSLTAQLPEKDRQLSIQIEHRLDHQGKIYSSSLACLVMFGANTLIIDRFRLGYLKMLCLPVYSRQSQKK